MTQRQGQIKTYTYKIKVVRMKRLVMVGLSRTKIFSQTITSTLFDVLYENTQKILHINMVYEVVIIQTFDILHLRGRLKCLSLGNIEYAMKEFTVKTITMVSNPGAVEQRFLLLRSIIGLSRFVGRFLLTVHTQKPLWI